VIPGWKIRREITRLGQQLRAIPEMVTDPIRQRHHDQVVFPSLGFREGQRSPGSRVAIYLLYQPQGIGESTVYTCGFLAAKGYSVLIVSNAPVSEADAARLSPQVWRIVERPNFGHDFGGYRDGIRLLQRWGVSPGTLLILNDSVWFPLDPRSRVIEDLEAHPAPLAGAVLRERGAERFLESYLYRIDGRLLSEAAFRDFWEAFRLTSNKYHVIRRGERDFSHKMRAAGHEPAAIYRGTGLPGWLSGQDDAILRKTLLHAAYVDAELAAERDTLLASDGPEWRAGVLDHVRRTTEKRQAYSSFPYAMVALAGYTLLKKSRDPVSLAWRTAYLAAVKAGDLPPPAAPIRAELSKLAEEGR
jgi:hypothetical protein